MKGALIHGVLLAVMLVYGYRTWTRDKTVGPNLGAVVLWDRFESDLVSIEYTTDKKAVKVERRGQGSEAYWWGTDTTTEKKPKPPEPKKPDPGTGSGSAGSGAGSGSAGSGAGSAAKAEGSGAGSAVASKGSGAGSNAGSAAGSGAGSGSAVASVGSGSAAGSGSAVANAGSGSNAGSGAGSGSAIAATTPEKPPEDEVIKKVREFPLGKTGDELIRGYLAARALRDLGPPSDKDKKDYKLTESKGTIVVAFKDGKHTFVIGGPVYGGSDKYVLDKETGRAYVLSKDLISALEIGESSLHLTEPRGFEVTKIESVTIEAGGKTKSATRINTGDDEGKQVKTWADADTKKADQTLANFIDNTNNLKPSEFSPGVKVAELTQIMKLTYKDAGGKQLGTLVLYKRDKPGATPPAMETEYYILTEKTRVPAVVRKDTAQRTEQDVPTVFGAPPIPRETPIDPKNNPFGAPPKGGPAPDPHGSHGH